MKTNHFLKKIEKHHLVQAIQEAERGSSGDVVLFISHKKVEDAMTEAHAVFHKLKLEETTPRNALLIFLAPESQKLAVIGGTDLYGKLPPEWWTSLVSTMSASFAADHLTGGLLAALGEIGLALRTHFPAEAKLDRLGQSDLLEEG